MKSRKISRRTTEKQKEKVQCAVTPESYPILPVELSEKKKAQRMCTQLAWPDEAFLGGGMHTASSSVPVLQPCAG